MRIGGKIDSVNKTFIEMIPLLRQIQEDDSPEFELRISIMTFNQEAKWLVTPTLIMEYNQEDLVCDGGVACFSDAFKKLGEKLTRKEYMAHTGKIAQPYIMLMTDGEPTPDDNYQPTLEELLGNGWFKASQRFAVLIGTDAINSQKARDAVAQFVTNPTEGIISIKDVISTIIDCISWRAPHFPAENHQRTEEMDESEIRMNNIDSFDITHFSDLNWDDVSFY